ncbi:MAG: hypothetical protein J7598_22665 [Mitsuaria chitosanitabida]|nr:hypothetical protein [Roseateles chitosanitabidus]
MGLAVSLILMAGAFAMAGLQLGEQHRLMLELQVQQELRATAELMQRDLRRSGYWERAQDGLWREDNPSPARNPFGTISVDAGGQRLGYRASASDTSGFRLADGRVEQLVGGRYQPLTDPALLRVLALQVSLNPVEVPVRSPCATLSVLELRILIDAEAVHDRRVRHRLDALTRLRNDRFSETCP